MSIAYESYVEDMESTKIKLYKVYVFFIICEKQIEILTVNIFSYLHIKYVMNCKIYIETQPCCAEIHL